MNQIVWVESCEKVHGAAWDVVYKASVGLWSAVVLFRGTRWHITVWHRTRLDSNSLDTFYAGHHPGFESPESGKDAAKEHIYAQTAIRECPSCHKYAVTGTGAICTKCWLAGRQATVQ